MILPCKTYLPVILVYHLFGKYILLAKTETKIIFGTLFYAILKDYSTSESNILW